MSYLDLGQRLIDHCKERDDLIYKYAGDASTRGERRIQLNKIIEETKITIRAKRRVDAMIQTKKE